MPSQTELEIDQLRTEIAVLRQCVETLQALAKQHHKAIKALNEYVEA